MISRPRYFLLPILLCSVLAAAAAAAATAGKPPRSDENDYELYKALIDAMDQVERNYVVKVDRRELVEAAIRGVLAKLDPYSAYVGPEEVRRFRAGLESEFAGIGIQVTIDDGQLTILSPLPDTPAYRAGLQAGDRIVEVEGKSTDNFTLDEAVERLQGAEGTVVNLSVVHAGSPAKQKVTLKREKIHIDTVLGDHRKPDGAWDYMFDPQQRIAYVRLVTFGRDSAAALRQVLTRLKKEGMRGLVLDLRFDPGGLLAAAIDVCQLFISDGRIVSIQGRNVPERSFDAHQDGALEGFPMVVLVNHFRRQRQRNRRRLPPGPSSRDDHRRADLGQGKRAERGRTGRRQKRLETHHRRLPPPQRQEHPPLPRRQGNGRVGRPARQGVRHQARRRRAARAPAGSPRPRRFQSAARRPRRSTPPHPP